MRYRNILPSHKKYQFQIIYNSFSWCRRDRNCKFNINYKKVFLYFIKRVNIGLFAVETFGSLFTWF